MFMIISPDDCQVYEMKSQSKKDVSYLQELIAYSSLDTGIFLILINLLMISYDLLSLPINSKSSQL